VHNAKSDINKKHGITCLIIPHFDLVVITAGHDERLVEVKVNATDRALVFLEAIDNGPNAVVPPEQRKRERKIGDVE